MRSFIARLKSMSCPKRSAKKRRRRKFQKVVEFAMERSRRKFQNDEASAKERKRSEFLDFVEGKVNKSKNESKMMTLRVGGERGKEYLQTLEEISNMMNFGDSGKQFVHNLEEEELVNGHHLRQTADRIAKEKSLDSGMVANDQFNSFQDNLSIDTITEISESSLSLSRTLSTGSSAPLKGQIRASHGKSIGLIRAEEIRAAHLRLCSFCNKNVLNLSSAPGCNIFSCSHCRRNLEVVDPPSLNIDFQNHAAQPPGDGPMRHINDWERDLIGRTPDTPVKIDSSSEEEDATNESAVNSRDIQFPSDLQFALERVTYPSRADPEAIDILASDILRLEPSEFLNDTIIDFFILYIKRELLSLEGGRRFHFFNSFFYKKLSSVAGKKTKKISPDFSKILNWTKGINIFEKDYLIVPVHGKLHWSLAIICFPKYGPGSASHCERCILHLDSMTYGHESRTVFRLLRRYLVAKWKATYGGSKMEGEDCIHTSTYNVIPATRVPVPLQENESDCGLFLLHYIRKFVENAPRTMKISDVEDRLEDLDVFGLQWFSPVEASSLRGSIQEQLLKLFAENERAAELSSVAFVGIHEVVKPQNEEAEYSLFSVFGAILPLAHAYESQFIQRLARLHRPDLMSRFKYAYRYIDDLCIINNGMAEKFLSPEQTRDSDNPFWIYPLQVLEIKTEISRYAETNPTRGIAAHFMNLDIVITDTEQATPGNFALSKFDKRRQLPFTYAQYIAFRSNRPVKQSYGIVISQTVPILYLSSEVSSAAREVRVLINTLEKNGFNRTRLVEAVVRFIKSTEFPGVRFDITALAEIIR